MTEISYNLFDSLIILAYFVSIFLVGFIPGFYLFFLIFNKAKLQLTQALLFSLLIGIVLGIFGFYPVIYFVYFSFQSVNKSASGIALPTLVVLEIVAVATHFFYFRKKKKR